MPRWFLLLNGVALLIMGITLFTLRLRERPLLRHLAGFLWALLCCTVGLGLLLMAQGHLAQPGMHPAKPRPHLPEFPSGR